MNSYWLYNNCVRPSNYDQYPYGQILVSFYYLWDELFFKDALN